MASLRTSCLLSLSGSEVTLLGGVQSWLLVEVTLFERHLLLRGSPDLGVLHREPARHHSLD